MELKVGERVVKESPSYLVPDPNNGVTLSSTHEYRQRNGKTFKLIGFVNALCEVTASSKVTGKIDKMGASNPAAWA
jgi:hypothetical protein